jgi:hypothetical protein
LEVPVTNITIALSDDRLAKLKDVANRLGVPPEELVRASIDELLASPDEVFHKAAEYVLRKNAELYRRLA